MYHSIPNAGTIFVLLLLGTQALQADVKLPALFSSHAVLEKSAKVPVWGKADPGEKVTVTLGSNTAETTTGADGKWKTSLDLSNSVPGPFELRVVGKNTITLTDIMVGQVWLCSGQSNMAMSLNVATGGEEAARTVNPQLRLFTVKQAISGVPLDDCQGAWSVTSYSTAVSFSAVAYFFGSKLQKDLQVPIGLINASVPGTIAEAWSSGEALDTDPDLGEAHKKMINEINTYPQRLDAYLTGLPAWEIKYNRADRGIGALPTGEGMTPVNLPGEVCGPGAVWLRRIVTIPQELSGKPLSLILRGIPGLDTVYWKGMKIAETGLAKSIDGTGRNYAMPLTEAGDFPLLIRIFSSTGKIALPSPFEIVKTTPIPVPVVIPLTGAWQFKLDFELPLASAAMLAEIPPFPGINPLETGKASVLYNGMIHPLAPYAIAGAIWYQGESNGGRAYQYRTLFPLLIKGWRDKWGQGDFPFYYCQLPNYKLKTATIGDADWAELREAQSMTLSVPKTGQAVLIDVGEEANLHPVNKKDPAERLALLALAQTYGKNVVSQSPLYVSFNTVGDKIRILFKNTDGGLVAKTLPATYVPKVGAPEKPLELYSPNSQLQGFIICGADQKWEWANASIEGNEVVVSSSKVPLPVAVRYAWAYNPTCNLYNGAGLPASPFRTDDFPISTRYAMYRSTWNYPAGWTQIGTTDPNTYSTPDSTAAQPAFSSLGNVPAELAIVNGVVPNLKVTYHLVVNGTTGFMYQTSGRHGLMLYAGATPNINDGLFTGDNTWSYKTYGVFSGNTGQPPQPTGSWIWDNATDNGRPNTFDVTVEIMNGVATTTMQTIRPAGFSNSVKTWQIPSTDMTNWNGQMKFAAFRGGFGSNYNYSRSYVSNISFYKWSP